LKGDLYPNTTHTYLECRECFGIWEALGICQNKLVRLGGCNHDLLTTNSRVDNPPKVTWEAHASSWRVKCQAILHESLHDLANRQVTCEALYLDDFNCDSCRHPASKTERKTAVVVGLRLTTCRGNAPTRVGPIWGSSRMKEWVCAYVVCVVWFARGFRCSLFLGGGR